MPACGLRRLCIIRLERHARCRAESLPRAAHRPSCSTNRVLAESHAATHCLHTITAYGHLRQLGQVIPACQGNSVCWRQSCTWACPPSCRHRGSAGCGCRSAADGRVRRCAGGAGPAPSSGWPLQGVATTARDEQMIRVLRARALEGGTGGRRRNPGRSLALAAGSTGSTSRL